MYHYFLVHKGCEIYRLGIEGDKDLARSYLEKYFRSVMFVDTYKELFYFDIDKYVGIGERKIDGGIIRTCKLVHTLMPRTTYSNIYERLEKVHKHIKEREENEKSAEV